ncbi:MAG: carboxylesterase family protein [Planctomycetota bacterium]|jgi:predicted peptidase
MNQSPQLKRYVVLWGAVVAALFYMLLATPEAAAQRGGRRGGEVAGGKVSEGWVELYEPHADDEMPYRLMKPIHFDSSKRYPVIVSLHGGGGRGTDNRKQLRGWNKLLAEEQRRSDYPCYVLAPQANRLWDAAHLKSIKDVVAALPSVDMGRIYILGHSMGGHGTYILIQIDPGYFAAAAPSAGSGLTRTEKFIDASLITQVPIWAFHGDNDKVCPYERDRKLFDEMKKLGGNMKLTTWAGDGHGVAEKMITGADNGSTQLSSDRCDGQPEFMKWLFAKKLRSGEQQDRPRKLNRGAGVPQEIIHTYEARVFKGMPYRLLLPANHDPARKYPLILNLHGGGGVGNDNKSNLRDWSAKFVDAAWREKYPCIVVTPQAAGRWSITGETVPELTEALKKTYSEAWQARLGDRNYPPGPMPNGPLTKALVLIDHLTEEFAVDTNRIYVLGHSMGGAGSWNAVWAAPERFAAAIPSAGGLLPWKDPAKFKHVPIWAFHGGSDPVVPTGFSREIFVRMKQVGGNLKYTELKDVKHNASQYAFYYEGDKPEKGYVTQYSSDRCDKTADVWDWLFSQRLDKR